MRLNRKEWFIQGAKAGIPIALGYFAVSFTLGITAKKLGFNMFQAALSSIGCMASAGQFIGYASIAAGAGILELFLMEVVASSRYILMSCALSQKLEPGLSLIKKIGVGYCITDEIFAVSMSQTGLISPYFCYGAMSVAVPGWTFGTCLGVLLGEILPQIVVTSFSVALYAMFLAVIIPESKRDRKVALLVLLSMGASYLFSVIEPFSSFSFGMRTLILTLVLASVFALLFPVEEEPISPEEVLDEEEVVS